MPVTITRDRVPELLRAVKILTKRRVLVGVPDEKADRPVDPDENRGPITNAALAYIHETGIPSKNIPARPFLVPGIRSIEPELVKRFKTAGEKALNGGTPTDIEKALTTIGLRAQSAVQAKITDGPFQPLADATLAARRARGNKSEKPLIDSGKMRQAISFVIRDKGK